MAASTRALQHGIHTWRSCSGTSGRGNDRRGTPCRRTQRWRNGVSLPLMGIRNREFVHRRHHVRNLTTPHGDQKHPEKPAIWKVIPSHYPSWGSETIFGVRQFTVLLRENSLPLMGIRNTNVHPEAPTGRSAHYPSWGSETRSTTASSGARLAHYPSWGSETWLPRSTQC